MLSKKLLPSQGIPGLGGLTVGDYWSWAYSDVLSNTNRGIFAEFLVGSALGLLDRPRVEWDFVDLRYEGRMIEVKSSAYLQSWEQKRHSTIQFDIAKKIADIVFQDNLTATGLDRTPTRHADCYVFCLYPEKNLELANILDVHLWHFYVMSQSQVNEAFGDQKSVRLSRVIERCPHPTTYRELKERVDAVLRLGSA